MYNTLHTVFHISGNSTVFNVKGMASLKVILILNIAKELHGREDEQNSKTLKILQQFQVSV